MGGGGTRFCAPVPRLGGVQSVYLQEQTCSGSRGCMSLGCVVPVFFCVCVLDLISQTEDDDTEQTPVNTAGTPEDNVRLSVPLRLVNPLCCRGPANQRGFKCIYSVNILHVCMSVHGRRSLITCGENDEPIDEINNSTAFNANATNATSTNFFFLLLAA